MSADQSTLESLLAWLDTHINYERTGMGSGGGVEHDPEHRLQLLRSFLDIQDNPQALFSQIHVTGTNGKTSTSRMITALIMANGLRTGTYTSPHLERLNERIMVNGEPIADVELFDLLLAAQLLEPMLEGEKGEKGKEGEQLSYFELLTSSALRHFADAPVEVGVIEVGVGGKYDATNVIDAAVAVVTNVGLDHTNYLGPTREDVAEHKAGIVKDGSALVISETDETLLPIFTARTTGPVYLLGRDFDVTNNRVAVGGRLVNLRTPLASYEDVFIALLGEHQAVNAATSLMAAEAFFGQALSEETVRQAFGAVSSPGRLEVVNRRPLTVLDGAHNVAGAQALVKALDEEFAVDGQRIFVIGLLDPHEPAEILTALQAGKARLVIATEPDSPRAVPAQAIADAAKTAGTIAVVIKDSEAAVKEALATATEDDLVVITGSLYTVGTARTQLLDH